MKKKKKKKEKLDGRNFLSLTKISFLYPDENFTLHLASFYIVNRVKKF